MKTLALWLLPSVLLLSGCSTQQANRSLDSIAACAIANQQKRDAIDEGFIAGYRQAAQAQADQLAAAALAAETGADGKASVRNVELILERKAQHYAQIESSVVGMRRKIVAAHLDMVSLLAYNEQLRQYFKGAADTGNLLNQSSEQLVELLQQFIAGKKAAP